MISTMRTRLDCQRHLTYWWWYVYCFITNWHLEICICRDMGCRLSCRYISLSCIKRVLGSRGLIWGRDQVHSWFSVTDVHRYPVSSYTLRGGSGPSIEQWDTVTVPLFDKSGHTQKSICCDSLEYLNLDICLFDTPRPPSSPSFPSSKPLSYEPYHNISTWESVP